MTCPKCFGEKEYNWQVNCESCHSSFKRSTEHLLDLHNEELGVWTESYPVGSEFGSPQCSDSAEELETAAKPRRYNSGSIEVWDAIEQLNFNYKQGNVLKYISRYKDKKGPEDLAKAINYIIKMISEETGIDYYELHKLTPEELGQRIKK